MKILHVNFSDSYGGAAIAVMRIHKLLLKNEIDSNLLVSDQMSNEPKTFSINKTSEKLKNIISRCRRTHKSTSAYKIFIIFFVNSIKIITTNRSSHFNIKNKYNK